jgi:dTDP-4-dehydrorhamnose reductase
MSLSFTPEPDRPLAGSAPARRRVLVTGAAGSIGSYFAEHGHARYDLRLMVMRHEKRVEHIRGFGEVVTADLANLDRLKEVCRGMDTVVHLAANADPSTPWNDLLQNNIVGTYNVMVAAKAEGCRRVIYASSIHAISGYPPDVQVKTTEPVNPGDLYGVSKCFGEALGRYMAEREGLSVIALRIGAFGPPEHVAREGGHAMLDMFVSQRDLQQMVEKCIDVENLRWAVFHAVSDNRFKRLDITDARELIGYRPQDDAAEINPRLRELRFADNHHTASLRDKWQQSGLREQL